jgi:hypothetical protein
MEMAMEDGWIEWGGGETAPVADDVLVEIRLRIGMENDGEPPFPAGDTRWTNTGSMWDIIAYRPAKMGGE